MNHHHELPVVHIIMSKKAKNMPMTLTNEHATQIKRKKENQQVCY
uniref:Uncharacterized protein n=1 Tax=Arundo donax TaxID=35708 RepID=A0A0A9EWI6_ARUDO